MLEIRNKRTGVTGKYPRKQAEWFLATGKCELVEKPAKQAAQAKGKGKKKAEPAAKQDEAKQADTDAQTTEPETQADAENVPTEGSKDAAD